MRGQRSFILIASQNVRRHFMVGTCRGIDVGQKGEKCSGGRGGEHKYMSAADWIRRRAPRE